ncbi:MAG: hypothetical protein V4506_19275 [Bacteroidota bacterium]
MKDNGDGTITIDKKTLDDILATSEQLKHENEKLAVHNKELATDIVILYTNIMKVLKTLNLTDDEGMFIHPDIVSKKVKPMKLILKGGYSIFKKMALAKVDKQIEDELNQTYAFIDEAEPIILKYGNLIHAAKTENKKIV